MPSFNFTSQRPIALTTEGLQVEFTEGVDIAVPIPADQVTVAPIAGVTGADAQAVLAELAGDDSAHAAGTGVHTIAGVTGLQAALDGKQTLSTSLTNLAATVGVGFLKQTAPNTWAIDTKTYITTDNLKDTPQLSYDLANTRLKIEAAGVGGGREMFRIINTDTSTGAAAWLSIRSGASTNNAQIVQYGTEYTTVPAMAGKSAVQSIGGNLIVRSSTADTDIEMMPGGTTTRMVVKSTGIVELAGNLLFVGDARRIQGVFDGSTRSLRTLFQTSTVNGNTNIGWIPNGTGVQSALSMFSSSDPDNSSFFSVVSSASNITLSASFTGTAAAIPLILRVGSAASTGIQIDTLNNTTIYGDLLMGSRLAQHINLYSTTYGLGVQGSTLYSRSAFGFAWFKGGIHSDTVNDPGSGGTKTMDLDSSGNLNVLNSLKVGGTQVMGARKTGWTLPTATLNRGALTNSSTLADVIGRLAALITDGFSHGSIGA